MVNLTIQIIHSRKYVLDDHLSYGVLNFSLFSNFADIFGNGRDAPTRV